MIEDSLDYGLVSIIMPAYNGEQYILDSIESVVSQSYENWELLVIDDCSTDGTRNIVRSLGDSRIRLLCNKVNSGAAISRNYGLREAKGRWVAFLDSDDLWLPQKLEHQLKYMVERDISFSYTDYAVVGFNGEVSPFARIGPDVVNKRLMWRYCYFSTITVMYDASVMGVIQIADIRKNNDYALWLKAIEKADAHRLPECLSIYCRRNGSISSGSKWRLVKHHYILFRKACGLNPAVSIFCTTRNIAFGVLKKVSNKEPLSTEVMSCIVRRSWK